MIIYVCVEIFIWQIVHNWNFHATSSSSSTTGPGAYAPDAPQPIGLLCDPEPLCRLDVPTPAARCLHVQTTREILAAKGGTVDENAGR